MNKPNVIVIMTDDQGYGDLSCMGATDFVTPHLDEMARSGARFSCMYSNSPVCSPSRASLLTGRYPGYAGVRAILAGHRRASGLTPAAPTFGTALRKEGYHTGIVGKWHLGLAENSRPLHNGFDQFYGFMAGCIDYYSHIFYWGMADGHTNPTHDLWDNENEVYRNGEYMTDLITRKSVEYIQEHKQEPFLLYVGYNAPHYPMHAPEKYLKRFAHLPWDRQIMTAMISAVDDGVGEIRAELERQGLLENTLIYFQSDNGPSRESRNWLDGREDPYYGGTSGHFTGHKFSLFEGGVRIPAMVSWPAAIPAGQVIDTPCASMDVFPTLLDAVGGDASAYELDGHSILSMLQTGKPVEHDQLFWEMEQQTAMRQGDYKLVLNGALVEGEPAKDPVFLSNLADDPGEKHNLAQEMPELTQQMTRDALAWRKALEENWDQKFASNYKSLT
ncbi:MAG: sulfatase-like hydrolase/transferase [Eubacteriales bacterium]|nr:sulfatase-like hydrolase/transferase [Eubacteriales bacterium]